VASKFVERFKQGCANVTDDRQTNRQTDHATEKCVAVGKIVCAARSDFA